jgi:hypothetical protein
MVAGWKSFYPYRSPSFICELKSNSQDFLPNFVLYTGVTSSQLYSREVLISQMDDLAHNLLTKSIPQRLLRRFIPERKREKSSIKRERKRASNKNAPSFLSRAACALPVTNLLSHFASCVLFLVHLSAPADDKWETRRRRGRVIKASERERMETARGLSFFSLWFHFCGIAKRVALPLSF